MFVEEINLWFVLDYFVIFVFEIIFVIFIEKFKNFFVVVMGGEYIGG